MARIHVEEKQTHQANKQLASFLDGAEDLHCPEETGLPPNMEYIRPARPLPLDVELTEWRNWLGWSTQSAPKRKTATGGREKIVVISDPHCPYLDEDAFKECLRREAHDATRCVVSGDVANLGAFSSFPHFKTEAPALEQFRYVQKFLNTLNESFPLIDVMEGNHDARQLRWLVRCKDIPAEILDLFHEIAPGALNMLIPAVQELKNVRLVGEASYQDAKFSFFHQVGDIIFGHAETYSKIEGRAVHNFAHWLKSLAEPYGLVKPFRIVCQAHTHQHACTHGDYGLRMYELGCMTRLPEYAGSPRIATPRPWWVGYHVFIQYDGVTDLNESYFVDLNPWRR